MGTISKNFDYKEFEKTDVPGMQVRNTITSTEVRDSVKALVDEVLQPLRDACGEPLAITGGHLRHSIENKRATLSVPFFVTDFCNLLSPRELRGFR